MAGGDFEIDGRSVIEIIVGAFTAVLGWLWVRQDAATRDHGRRLVALETSTVTRQELEETLEKQISTMRNERKTMHDENKEQFRDTKAFLGRIEGKVDANDRTTQLIATQVAVLQATKDGGHQA